MRLNLTAVLTTCLAFSISNSVSAGLMTYTDQSLFELAAPGLFVEDFEVGTTVGGASGVGPSVNSTTNAGNINPGEILPGINLTPIGTGVMVSLGSGIGGLTSNGVAPDLFADEMRLDLLPSVFAVGFDLTTNFTGTVDALFYNDAALLGTLTIATSSSGLNFGGALAFGGDVITRVDFANESPTGQGVIIDNLQFGNPTNVPIPATLALFGLGLAGLGWSRRKKA